MTNDKQQKTNDKKAELKKIQILADLSEWNILAVTGLGGWKKEFSLDKLTD